MLKFTGDFKELKKLGFEYRKTHEQNCIYYRRDEVLIWKKGRDIELADCYGKSDVLYQYLEENDFQIPNRFQVAVINMETGKAEDYDQTIHEGHSFMNVYTDEEMNQFYKRYKKMIVSSETIESVRELHEKKWIEVEEEKSRQ